MIMADAKYGNRKIGRRVLVRIRRWRIWRQLVSIPKSFAAHVAVMLFFEERSGGILKLIFDLLKVSMIIFPRRTRCFFLHDLFSGNPLGVSIAIFFLIHLAYELLIMYGTTLLILCFVVVGFCGCNDKQTPGKRLSGTPKMESAPAPVVTEPVTTAEPVADAATRAEMDAVKALIKKSHEAVCSDDAKAFTACSVQNEKMKSVVDTIFTVMKKQYELEEAIVKRFGEDGLNLFYAPAENPDKPDGLWLFDFSEIPDEALPMIEKMQTNMLECIIQCLGLVKQEDTKVYDLNAELGKTIFGGMTGDPNDER